MKETPLESGVLYVVATPIGNLEDITLRALRVLREVWAIAAEDTRHTRKLLSHHEISNRLISLNADAEKSRAPEILALLESGRSVAVVSDAGTPGSSDPGGELVAAARAAGLRVCPVPGPSAITAAVSTCGAATDRFAFEGFLPRAGEKRRRRLAALAAEDRPVVLFESPRRVRATLADLFQVCGDRIVSLHREQTKMFEDIRSISLGEYSAGGIDVPEIGEYTLIVMPGRNASDAEAGADTARIASALEILESQGLSTRDAVGAVAGILAVSRRTVYDIAKGRDAGAGIP